MGGKAPPSEFNFPLFVQLKQICRCDLWGGRCDRAGRDQKGTGGDL